MGIKWSGEYVPFLFKRFDDLPVVDGLAVVEPVVNSFRIG